MAQRALLIGFILSVVLNILLLLQRAPAQTETSPSVPALPPQVPPVQTVHHPDTPAVQPAKTNALLNWADLESPDYKSFIENLRAIGCPEQTVRDIVSKDLEKHYQKRKWEVLKSSVRTDFWSSDYTPSSTLDSEMLEKLLAIDKEFNDVYRTLLQAEPDDTHQFMNADAAEREVLTIYGPLPAQKLQRISDRVESLRIQSSWLAPGDPRHESLQAKAEETIMNMLSPAEREDYNLRTSGSASALRRGLAGFTISEAEFRQAFEAVERVRTGNPELKVEDIVHQELLRSLDPQRAAAFLKMSAATAAE